MTAAAAAVFRTPQTQKTVTTPAANANADDTNGCHERDRRAYKVHSLILYFLFYSLLTTPMEPTELCIDPPISATTTYKKPKPQKKHKCCSCLGFQLLAFFFDAVPAPPIPGYPRRFANLWQALTTSHLTPPSLEHKTEGRNMMRGFPPSFLCDTSRNRTLLATQIYYICVNSKYYNLIFFQVSEINGWIGYAPLLSSHY